MNFLLLLLLFAMVWLTFGMIALGTRAKVRRGRDDEMDGLRDRIKVLEALLTDQDRSLRRDFDGLT